MNVEQFNLSRVCASLIARATSWRAVALTVFSVALAGMVGCGRTGPVVEYVEGTVTLNGAPVDGATVAFKPVDGGLPASGITDTAGVYRLNALNAKPGKGTAAGDYLVSVLKWKDPAEGAGPPPDPSDTAKYEAWQRENRKGASSGPIYITPKAYSDATTSGLRATVKKGRNSGDAFRFDLKSDFKGH